MRMIWEQQPHGHFWEIGLICTVPGFKSGIRLMECKVLRGVHSTDGGAANHDVCEQLCMQQIYQIIAHQPQQSAGMPLNEPSGMQVGGGARGGGGCRPVFLNSESNLKQAWGALCAGLEYKCRGHGAKIVIPIMENFCVGIVSKRGCW